MTATYFDGYRNEALLCIAGLEADAKARRTGEALLERTRALLLANGHGDYTETHLEVLGAEAMYGPNRRVVAPREVVLKIAVKHPQRQALELFAREFAAASTAMSPGTMLAVAGRPKPLPLIRVFSCLVPKADVPVTIVAPGGAPGGADGGADGGAVGELLPVACSGGFVASASECVQPVEAAPCAAGPRVSVPLVRLCWGRSGDKGDTANVGLIARRAEYLPLLRDALSEGRVGEWFGHAVEGEVRRYDLPGIGGLNFVLTRALGGGGTSSLRTDSLAKAFCQQLLSMPVEVPAAWFGDDDDPGLAV